MLSDAEVERVLVVTAHPDDVDFGAAGTIAGWTDAGVAVSYCVLTDGDAGGFDPAEPRERIPAVRRAEQRAAAAEVGVTDVRFLGFPDGRLQVSLALRAAISRVIRAVRPQRVLCQSPARNYARIPASHPDHLAAGEAALCAVYPDARNPFAHPELLAEGLDAWTVAETWLMGFEHPNHYVDVTERFDRKLAALRRHSSQLPGVADLPSLLQEWLGGNARSAGLPAGRLAEAFYVVATG